MKKLLFTAIILTGLISYGQKNQTTTLIDRIEKAEKIPVIISLGDVKSEAFNSSFAVSPSGGTERISLSQRESRISPVNATFPNKIDSLIPAIVNELNAKFGTNKFTFNSIVNNSTLMQTIQTSGYELIVNINFTATYGYKYGQGNTKRVADPKPSDPTKTRLVSKRTLKGTAGIKFWNSKGEKISYTPLMVSLFNPFDNARYINDANVLMKIKSPLVLINSYRVAFPKRIEKLASKAKKKHAKALKKRK